MKFFRHKHKLKKLYAGGVILFLGACASSSLFISYPQQFAKYKQQIIQGNIQESAERLSLKGSGPNSLLDTLEAARIAQLAGNQEKSRQLFKKAFALFDATDERAKLSLSEGGELLGSVVVNDNAFKYDAAAYERIFAYHYQSFNYLKASDKQGALVEIRRANEEQVLALDNHEKELRKAKKEAESEDIDADPDQYKEKLAENFKAANKVKNSFQNAYTFYYSGIIRESSGDLNGAYIDFKKALEIYPDNNFVQRDVWRLAKQLQMRDDLNTFESLVEKQNQSQQSPGNLIIFYEQNFIPAKEEIMLPFQSYERIYNFAFPAYLTPWQSSQALTIQIDDSKVFRSDEIIDTHALAAKALQEGAFKRLLRQMLRVNAKARIQREAYQENNLTGFFGNVYSLLSERADLRSWLSLPKSVHVARHSLEVGSHTIHLANATFRHEINVSIEAGETLIVRIYNPDNQHIYQDTLRF